MADMAPVVIPARAVWAVIAAGAVVIGVVVTSYALSVSTGENGAILRPGSTGGDVATERPSAPLFTEADAEFVAGMIPHHEQALALVTTLESRVTQGDTLALAQRMRDVQTGELNNLRAWSADHAALMSGHEHRHATGMLTAAEVDSVSLVSGRPAEIRFLELMIRHHRGALDMAATRLAQQGEAVITEFAHNVFADQTFEIARMEELLTQLGAARD